MRDTPDTCPQCGAPSQDYRGNEPRYACGGGKGCTYVASLRDRLQRAEAQVAVRERMARSFGRVVEERDALRAERDQMSHAIHSWYMGCQPQNAADYETAYHTLAEIAERRIIDAGEGET